MGEGGRPGRRLVDRVSGGALSSHGCWVTAANGDGVMNGNDYRVTRSAQWELGTAELPLCISGDCAKRPQYISGERGIGAARNCAGRLKRRLPKARSRPTPQLG